MSKFKIQGRIIEELPEKEIEAQDIDEAEEIYSKMYEQGKIEGDSFEIDFGSEEEVESNDESSKINKYGISNDGWDEMPRIVKGINGEEFFQDYFGVVPLKFCKIYGLSEDERPNEVLDYSSFVFYYEKMGYLCLGGLSDESNIMKFKRKVDKEQKRLF
jgi:hypothetical protein